ncbi:MAG: TIR domain-containing protein [Blastocatellia bacterium]
MTNLDSVHNPVTVPSPQYDVFLSHNSADKPFVEQLAARLADEARLTVFLDKWHLVPGDPWQEALEEALDASRTCVVFLGPNGLGPWENEELRAALDDRVRNQEFRVIPALLPGADPQNREAVPRFLRRLMWVDFRSGWSDQEAFERLVAGIRGHAPGRTHSSPYNPVPEPPRLPAVRLPSLLPYLCNRSEQETLLGTELRRQQQGKPRRPFVCVIHGDEMECHGDYLDRLRCHSLPKFLNLEARQQSVRHCELSWPTNFVSQEDFIARLWQRLGESLLENGAATPEEIFAYIARHEEPLMLFSHVLTEDLETCGERSLQALFTFCDQWQDLPPGRLVFYSLCLKYQRYPNVRLWDFRKKKLRQLNSQMNAWLSQLQFGKWSGLHGLVLPELRAIARRDVETWSRTALVRNYCQVQEREIRQLYERTELCNEDGHIAMEALAEELKQWVARSGH